jgi:hypothetical protein
MSITGLLSVKPTSQFEIFQERRTQLMLKSLSMAIKACFVDHALWNGGCSAHQASVL